MGRALKHKPSLLSSSLDGLGNSTISEWILGAGYQTRNWGLRAFGKRGCLNEPGVAASLPVANTRPCEPRLRNVTDASLSH